MIRLIIYLYQRAIYSASGAAEAAKRINRFSGVMHPIDYRNTGLPSCERIGFSINNRARLIKAERRHAPMVMRSSVINRRTIAIVRENRIARGTFYKGES